MATYSALPQVDGESSNYSQGINIPHSYYGDVSMSPRISLDDADDLVLEKSPNADSTRASLLPRDEESFDIEPPLRVGQTPRRSSLRFLLITLCSLLIIAGLIGSMAASSYSGTSFRQRGAKRITMDHIFNGTFAPNIKSLDWVAEAGDGVFSTENNGDIVLVDLKTNTSETIVHRSSVKDEHGNILQWQKWKLSPDMQYILFQVGIIKQWRHSSHKNYYIHHIADQTTHPMIPPSNPPIIAYAAWSPSGESIAYVAANDLYILPDPSPSTKPIRVTNEGNSSLFHGVPDWVYEEEVISDDFALWWSPDSTRLAFLKLDETQVNEYVYPVYNPSYDSHEVHPYTSFVTMKYPKPGYPNPLVSVHIFDLHSYDMQSRLAPVPGRDLFELTWTGQRDKKDSIIQEVVWVGDTSLIVKEVNRAGNDGSIVLFDVSTKFASQGRVVRTLGKKGEQGDNGWIDPGKSIYRLPDTFRQGRTAYLDILPNAEGFNHIALFNPADSSTPRWLTNGNWEVSTNILGVDTVKALVYFTAAAPTSIDRNIYAAKIPSLESSPTATPEAPKALTDDTQLSTHSASFSPESGFFVLNYEGPNVPWQKVIQVDDQKFEYVLTDNASLNETSKQYQMPTITRSTIMSDGYELNAMEIRPPSMDSSGRIKYPVLFRVYGGPGSQMVHSRFVRDWDHYLACSLKYIVVIVDGRGTGFKGRKLRNPVRGNLGDMEVKDQIEAARIWATKRYVDARRIGIWGWSYGGFMSSKVAEAGAGIHSLAMAVAPVTSWRLYDSIYTERYMDTPQNNPEGYASASISNVEGFRKIAFLLAHGSGDDNVHFANSAHLLDMLTQEHVRGFRFRMFTDSDHSIRKREAYRELYEWMTAFLIEKWGRGGVRRG